MREFDKHTDKRGNKDWRKPYRKSKAFDPSCRNHGGCGYCEENRTHSSRKSEQETQEQLDDFLLGREHEQDVSGKADGPGT